MTINWKENYIIKSVKSRPMLFVIACFLSSMLTYEITSSYSKRIYEKTVVKQRDEIYKLETNLQTLKSEMSSINTVMVEEFSEATGKIIKREQRSEKETATKDERKEENKTEVVVKEKEVIKEKEIVVKDIQKNNVFVGYGLGEDGDTIGSLGYQRRMGIFNLGIQFDSDQKLDDKSIKGTVGMNF